MRRDAAIERRLLDRAGRALERQGLRWEVVETGAAGHDAVVRVGQGDACLELAAEVKARPTAEVAVAALARRRKEERRGLLVADYVNPRLADRLREKEVFFVDTAGNAFLHGGGLHVWVTGERDAARVRAERERTARAFRPAGLKVGFALLCRPELVTADYRTLAQEAGVALGTVAATMRALVEEGYVVRRKGRERQLADPGELLDAWVQAYVRDLRPKLLLGRFATDRLDWWQDTDLAAYDALWGGEPAAALCTGTLKPGTLTLYAEKVPTGLVLDHGLRKDQEGRVEVRRTFWHFETPGDHEIVPAVLVYADLQAIGDARVLEVADRIYRERIDGPFRQHLIARHLEERGSAAAS